MNCSGQIDQATPHPPPPVGMYISLATIGTAGVCVNVITIIVIAVTKKLHNSCFKLIAGGSFGSLLSALGTASINLGRVGEHYRLWSFANRYRVTCLVMNLSVAAHVGFPFSAMTVSLIATDRLIGTLAPIKYQLLDKRYPVICLSLCATFALLYAVILVFVGGPLFQVMSTCSVISKSMGEKAYVSFISVNIAFNSLCVVCYSAMLIGSYVTVWKMKRQANGGFATAVEQQQFLKRQAAIMPAAKMMSTLYVLTQVVPLITDHFVANGGVAYYAVAHFKSCATFVEFLSLATRSVAFRKGLSKLFKRKNNSVTSVTGWQK